VVHGDEWVPNRRKDPESLDQYGESRKKKKALGGENAKRTHIKLRRVGKGKMKKETTDLVGGVEKGELIIFRSL